MFEKRNKSSFFVRSLILIPLFRRFVHRCWSHLWNEHIPIGVANLSIHMPRVYKTRCVLSSTVMKSSLYLKIHGYICDGVFLFLSFFLSLCVWCGFCLCRLQIGELSTLAFQSPTSKLSCHNLIWRNTNHQIKRWASIAFVFLFSRSFALSSLTCVRANMDLIVGEQREFLWAVSSVLQRAFAWGGSE